MTPEQIAAGLADVDASAILKTPLPQPMEGHFFWAGTMSQAHKLAPLGIFTDDGFSVIGLAVRAILEAHNG